MTREEAIECLNYQNEKFFGGQSEALKMAVLALSENKGFDGMTNGEVFCSVFDVMVLTIKDGKVWVEKIYFPFDEEWWNAPYQKGGEE